MALRLACHEHNGTLLWKRIWPHGLGRACADHHDPVLRVWEWSLWHPEQDRAISLREAAVLQTFPRTYLFTSPGERPTFKNVGRHIGNAVPVALAVAIGKSIMQAHGIESHRLQDAARTA